MQGAGEGEIEEDPQPRLGCLGSGGWWPPGGGDRSGAGLGNQVDEVSADSHGAEDDGHLGGGRGLGLALRSGDFILCVGGSGQVILKLECTIIVGEKGLGSLGILLAEAEIVTDGSGAR